MLGCIRQEILSGIRSSEQFALLRDQLRAYLVWQAGQARVLVDAGGGSALRFGKSGAKMPLLDVILFTHFHVDHSADFPALVFSSWFEERDRSLPVYGPAGNSEFPSTVDFVHAFFNNRNGIDRYLSVLLVPLLQIPAPQA